MDIKQNIISLIKEKKVKFTLHAQQELYNDNFNLNDFFNVFANFEILEVYPDHKRGACCLLVGNANLNRYMHVVCTYNDLLIVITVYEPTKPKWITPYERGNKDEM